jgi:hypothetical protein
MITKTEIIATRRAIVELSGYSHKSQNFFLISFLGSNFLSESVNMPSSFLIELIADSPSSKNCISSKKMSNET